MEFSFKKLPLSTAQSTNASSTSSEMSERVLRSRNYQKPFFCHNITDLPEVDFISEDLPDTSEEMETDEIINSTNINELPNEILQEIMSHIDHRDRLVARLVCRRWRNTVSDSKDFTENSVIKLARNSTVLEGSVVPWKNIVLTDLSKRDKPSKWNIPKLVNASLTSLVLIEADLKWITFTRIGARFPNLTKLFLVNCELETTNDPWTHRQTKSSHFLKLARRLKHLKIEGRNLEQLNHYLEQFRSDSSTLESFEVSLLAKSWEADTYQSDVSNYMEFTEKLTGIIVASSRSLKTFVIVVDYRMCSVVGRCLQNVSEKTKLDLHTFHLEWNVDIHSRFEFQSLIQTEHILKNFLLTQENLKTLYIPRLERHITQFQGPSDILNVLPMGIRDIGLGQLSIVTPALFHRLTELRAMKVDFPSTLLPTSPVAQHLVTGLSNNTFPGIQAVNINGNPLCNLMHPVVFAFPNLIKLEVDCSTGKSSILMINDTNLQLIIRHLPNLQVLRLSSGHLVTDYGISGIPNRSSQFLLNSGRSWVNEKDLLAFGIKRDGMPLSSLRNLKEFSLTGSFCHITDVGIHYGFGFKDLRKFGIVCDQEISYWGLMRLAEMNPNLEQCYLVSSSTKLMEAKPFFLKALPRLHEHASHFSFAGCA